MKSDFYIDSVALIILFGIFQGLFLAGFFIKKSSDKHKTNRYMGLLILSLSLIMLEGALNYTGYILKVITFSNFSEPLNFVIAPLLYLFMLKQLGGKEPRWEWVHFVPFIFWLIYSMWFFTQSDAFKYNAFIGSMQLTKPLLDVDMKFSANPLGISQYINTFTVIQFIIYFIGMLFLLLNKSKKLKESLFKTKNKTLKSLRNSGYHFLIILTVLIIVKLYYGNDVGDYFIYLYISFMIFMTSVQVVNESTYFNHPSSFLEPPILKYKKSSLSEEEKRAILKKITLEMEEQGYYKSNMASLSGLSKCINESAHHVSQVINEKLHQTFFELLAAYRIKEAQHILRSKEGKKKTIEEIAECVGYNSKSAFNTAFKKITSQTPSEYRDSN
ncbi:helix-turn-helix domain-containing protein [Leptobacterium sp. I13]|uniref:helix-turn-helix domain-containing protein n=1 Tax=Leptobacterium meishanense TaxID=3128904 RepID=UPI0030EC3F4F